MATQKSQTLSDFETAQKHEIFLRELDIKIKQTIEHRPTRDDAMSAIYSAYRYLKHATDILGEVFKRENEYQLYQDLAQLREKDLKEIK